MSTRYRSIDTEGIDGEGNHYVVIGLDIRDDIGIYRGYRDGVIGYGSYVVTRIRGYVYLGIGSIVYGLGKRINTSVSSRYRCIDAEGIDGEGNHYGVIGLDIRDDVGIYRGYRDGVIGYGSYVVTRIRGYVYARRISVIYYLRSRVNSSMSTWYRSIDTEGIDGEGYHYGVISLDIGR